MPIIAMMRTAAIALSLVYATAAVAADQCTYWVGIAQQESHVLIEHPQNTIDNTQHVTFRVRLRETRRLASSSDVRIELAHAGSIIEGDLQGTLSGQGGNVSSGHGQASVSGAMIGSAVLADKSGKPLQYALAFQPAGGTFYPTQTKWSRDGSVTTSNQPFQRIYIGKDLDPQKPRHFTGGVMQGNYEAHNSTDDVKVSWNLKSVVVPCARPPGIPETPPQALKRPPATGPSSAKQNPDAWKCGKDPNAFGSSQDPDPDRKCVDLAYAVIDAYVKAGASELAAGEAGLNAKNECRLKMARKECDAEAARQGRGNEKAKGSSSGTGGSPPATKPGPSAGSVAQTLPPAQTVTCDLLATSVGSAYVKAGASSQTAFDAMYSAFLTCAQTSSR